MSLIDKNSHVLAAPLEKSSHYGEETLIEAFVTTDSSPHPENRLLWGVWPTTAASFLMLVGMVKLCVFVQTH